MSDLKPEKRQGKFIETVAAGTKVKAYIPPTLPPHLPLQLERLIPLVAEAHSALGRLEGITSILPNNRFFLDLHIRKEALLSSQIEGTQSSFSDLLLFENKEQIQIATDDVVEVTNYVAALEYGLDRLKKGFPLSLRLIREVHGVLLQSGPGSKKQPGDFRQGQNWIGPRDPHYATYVPPTVPAMEECLSNMEKFIHADTPMLPPLIKAALIHVQFEMIHPFWDGNGRVGRLLVELILYSTGLLREPLLNISLYLKRNRQEYYNHLQNVQKEGAWEAWLNFFLKGVIEVSAAATHTAQKSLELWKLHRIIIEMAPNNRTMFQVHNLMQRYPVISIGWAANQLRVATVTVTKAIRQLEAVRIIREVSGKRRGKIYVYQGYLDILSEGTEPLPR